MKLTNYSNLFLKKLLAEFPEFEKYYTFKKYEDSEELYLLVEIPYKDIWISTYHDNLTIGFENQHTHFSFHDTDEEDFNAAIKFLKNLM